MYIGILIFCVISLTRIQSSQTLDDSKYSTGNQGSDFKNDLESDGQITDNEDSSPKPDTSRSSTLNIQKRDVAINDTTLEKPLILTPYIESGKIDEAKKLSEVLTSNHFLGVKCYTGFLTVNKWYNSNLFFWYFPMKNKTVSENPWIIWLQGGPGSSSMDGLFNGIGPLKVNDYFGDKISKRNPDTWLQDHSLVFIDNPVGTGFSFTNQREGYAKDMRTYALHLKLAVLQLLELFPELKTAPLFVGGESYGGKYAPALAMELHKAKQNGSAVNLQGVFTGNGFVDAGIMSLLPQTYYENSFLTKQQYESLQPLKKNYEDAVANNKSKSARDKFQQLFRQCVVLSDQNGYNFLRQQTTYDDMFSVYSSMLDMNTARRALHIGHLQFSGRNDTVADMLAGEFLTSARPLYIDLLNNGYKVMGYCGMSDLLLPCYAESDEYRRWNWTGKDEFLRSPRKTLMSYFTKYGYFKSGGNLTEVQLRGAGHYAAMDSPTLVRQVVTAWTHNRSLSL